MMLHYETVKPYLKTILDILMSEKLFRPFRLVGGTNLSLRYGHRISEDIDLFTDASYGSLDFQNLESFLRSQFPYYECTATTSIIGNGRSYYIGLSTNEYIKLDLMYTDSFIDQAESIDNIRMASVNDIVAMKMNVISRGGRKKDFWDLHFLLGEFSLPEMFSLHAQRHPWEHDPIELLRLFTDFSIADEFPDPICLLDKNWDDIKLDLIETTEDFQVTNSSFPNL